MTKNLYLKLMIRKVIPLFDEQGFNISEIKKEIIVSVADTGRFAGVYYPLTYEQNKSGLHEIEVDENIDNGLEATGVLIHEMCHAIQYHIYGDDIRMHGKEFRKIALSVGLEGPMRSTTSSKELQSKIRRWEKEIGPYPHPIPILAKTLNLILDLITYGGCFYLLLLATEYYALHK